MWLVIIFQDLNSNLKLFIYFFVIYAQFQDSELTLIPGLTNLFYK